MKVLVTGSAGLIGSEAVEFFDGLGFDVHGIDNNMRADFFGPGGDTTWNRQRLEATCRRYTHHDLDIRDRGEVEALIERSGYELVIHTAGQPSHDLAAARPFDDFDVNAVGTLNLLEATHPARTGGGVHHPVHQQGLRRQPQPGAARGARHPLGLRRSGHGRGHRRDDVARPLHPLVVRGVQGGLRPAHPGVRPLLRAAHGHVPRGLPHRAAPLGGRAPRVPQLPGPHRAAPGAVHDLRLQGEAGPRPDPLRRRGQPPLGLRAGPTAR